MKHTTLNISNIVLIVIDTLRSRNVGAYGKRPSPTPHIDKMASLGALFTHAYTTITKTDPSTTAIMSGRYPITNKIIGHGKWIDSTMTDPATVPVNCARILQKHGFYTVGIDMMSRWHQQGYDYYSGKLIKDVDAEKVIKDTLPFHKILRLMDVMCLRLFKRDLFMRFLYCFFPKTALPYDPADIIVDKAIEIQEKNKKQKTFFYLHFRDPHFPHVKPRGLRSFLFDSIEKRYDTEIAFVDAEIKRLFNHYKQQNILKDTLFIITSDHGESLTEHGVYVAHHDPYETVIKIPLILYHPGFKPTIASSIVQNVDIFPTILNLLNISIPSGTDGKSLVPLLHEPTGTLRSYAYIEDNIFGELILRKSRRKLCIVTKQYKYIVTLSGPDAELFSPKPQNAHIIKEEIYDLSIDPDEVTNIVLQQETVRNTLLRILERHVGRLHFE